MCDVYVTPYLNEAQMTSGTLAYSFGLGKAVVSTPYWHAKELLGDGRGILVPFGDAKAMSAEIAGLLTNDVRRHAMRKRAYAASRSMTWAQTAKRYLASFETAREHAHLQSSLPVDRIVSQSNGACYSRDPDRPFPLALRQYGHAPARRPFGGGPRSRLLCRRQRSRLAALERACGRLAKRNCPNASRLRFAAFIQHAWNPDTRRFRNFMSYDRRWLEETGSEDSHGRTLWALGECARNDTDPSRRRWAAALFKTALPVVEEFSSPRAWAFTLLGLDAYCAVVVGDLLANRMRGLLADRLMSMLAAKRSQDWLWFEDVLAYDNARLPQALIQTGLTTRTPHYVEAGLQSLRWLMSLQTAPSGCFRPVGTKSFGRSRQTPEAFDQQPVEAAATISACLAAWRADSGAEWPAGGNARVRLVSGRKRPADNTDRSRYGQLLGWASSRIEPNENKGAESALSYLLGLVEMRQFKRTAMMDRMKPTSKLVRLPEVARSHRERPQGATLSQSRFLNRQILHLRPDPARVVVRPFKPATEPRDLNPTDKTRANHIVGRVLRLEAGAAARQLTEVLENFEGRHSNLLEIFEARAAEMEEALEPHAVLNKTQRCLIGAYFLHEYSFEASALFNPSIVRHPDQSGAPENGLSIYSEPSRRRRRAHFIADVPIGNHRRGRQRHRRSDRASRIVSQRSQRRTSRPNGDDVEVIFPARRRS